VAPHPSIERLGNGYVQGRNGVEPERWFTEH
jgi:hypothetical protein